MRRYSQRQSLSTLSEINITPLLDLAFVLLIIFMITTPLLESSKNVVIPSSGAKNPPINRSQVQTVSIDRTDTIRFNNQVVDLRTLTAQLTDLKAANPDLAIVIRPDRDLPTFAWLLRKFSRPGGRGKRPILAKRCPDCSRARCADCGTCSLDSGSEGVIESGEHRLVR